MNSTVEMLVPSHKTIHSWKLVEQCKQIGEYIKEGEVLAKLSADDATLVVESQDSGILTRWMAEPSHIVEAGTPLLIIERTLKINAEAGNNQYPLILDDKIHVLSEKTSIADVYLQELRNLEVQQDRARFRHNLERLGEILAYRVSEHLVYSSEYIDTPLSATKAKFLREQPVLASILRAGLPLHQGFLRIFEQADNAYIAAYRKTTYNYEFEIRLEYVATPDLTQRELIVLDPMLATGSTLIAALNAMKTYGIPKNLHIVSVIASQHAIRYVRQNLPHAHIWTVAIDPELNVQSYIIPGLGDAGDLALGKKI